MIKTIHYIRHIQTLHYIAIQVIMDLLYSVVTLPASHSRPSSNRAWLGGSSQPAGQTPQRQPATIPGESELSVERVTFLRV
jgi:hypothetical protein